MQFEVKFDVKIEAIPNFRPVFPSPDSAFETTLLTTASSGDP